jgi:hypothetical protein
MKFSHVTDLAPGPELDEAANDPLAIEPLTLVPAENQRSLKDEYELGGYAGI